VLPVLLAAALAVAQFGYYFQRVQQLMLASRVGAEEASQTAGLVAGPVPANIANVINHQLASSNITPLSIIVEYQPLMGPEQVLRTDYPGYVPGSFPEPTGVLPLSTVRVTVLVPLSNLMPNSLSFFGFNTATRNAFHSTTFGYEL